MGEESRLIIDKICMILGDAAKTQPASLLGKTFRAYILEIIRSDLRGCCNDKIEE